MRKTLLLLVFTLVSSFTFAQKSNGWKAVNSKEIRPSEKIRKSALPLEYKLFQFDYDSFKSRLVNVPNRNDFSGTSNVIVSIPLPNGSFQDFRIVEASNFEESLQRRFPEIRSFAGNAVKDAGTVIRFSISPSNGLSAFIRTSNGEAYVIDPYSSDYKNVIVYNRAVAQKSAGDFICTTDDAVQQFGRNIESNNYEVLRNANDSQLRQFRMAQSCTGEYANYFGATSAAQVDLVLAAFNATYARVNAIFEMDFNATMQLIANTTDVIYYDPATDPYSNSSTGASGAWNNELGNTLQSVIGNANYDIGHLFGADGGGGNAGCIGCVCSADNSKGRGFTSPADGIPMGDNFDVDYVAHEIGHQLGGNHTFSMSSENNAVNMEPGSGVTIMGYAGITGATDVAAHSIPIFHAGSIEQITNNIKSKSCPTLINTGNAVPVPSAPATKILPIGTAFKLMGTATDADAGDVLSYCWEQVDDATTVGATASYPSGTKTNGANFRSYMPKNNGLRNFPRLQDHVANGVAGNQWEIVPTINRTLNFRMTVRDNKAGGGNNESVNTAVSFNTNYGPFVITSQNAEGISYEQGSSQAITWLVNNTTALAGSANVNIKLSIDGGESFPIILAANTPNDGLETVTIPNVSSPYCRILIEPTGNDFYAINTNDFAIGYTVSTICTTYTVTPNAALSATGYVGYDLNIPDNFIITDFNVAVDVTAGRTNNIRLGIVKPGSSVVDMFLFDGGGCANNSSNLNVTFDDAGTAFNCASPTSGIYQPVDPLSQFNGMNSQGLWRLAARIGSSRGNQSGTLNSFTFEVCYQEVVESPNACGEIVTTWDGTSWSNGAPLRNVAVVFDGDYTTSGDLEACSLTVNSGSVTVATGNTFTVGNEVVVNGSGVFTVENNAALIQENAAATNSGNIVVKRSSTPMIRQDYTAWSSPVNGQQLKAFSPNTIDTRFYEYLYTGTSTPAAYQTVNNLTNFLPAKGYMIRVDNNWSSTIAAPYNGQFTGVPFNGDLSINIGQGFNLLGNPYASPIDADKFLYKNEANIGALYFWTHTVAAVGGVYPQNNFASYTILGGTAAAAGGETPNGTIQVGQGVFVKAYESGNARFLNNQRVKASVSTQFFRTANTVETTPEKHRVWLNLNDDTNSFNQILVGYMQGATNGFDNLIDGKILESSNSMLYNILDGEKYIIQGRALPFTNEDIVPLGLKVATAGTFTISIDHVDGLFSNQDIFVKDNYENSIHDLKASAYTFTAQEGVYNDRFEVVYRDAALSNEDFVNSNNNVVVFANNEVISLVSSNETIKDVVVYDMLGRVLYNNSQVNEKEFNISGLNALAQTLIVKVQLQNGQSTTKKLIL